MKILILNTDYPEFLQWLYAQHPGLARCSYDEQMQVRNESLFGVADFYSRHLRVLGCDAIDLHANNEWMQRAWAREHGLDVIQPSLLEQRARKAWGAARRMGARTPLRHFRPMVRAVSRSLDSRPTWLDRILAEQIKRYRPDVILNHAVDGISSQLLRDMKPFTRLLVGQIASPLPEGEDFSVYQLMLSSLPNMVDQFRRQGLPSAYHRLAFDSSVLTRLRREAPRHAVSFVGSLSPHHETRGALLTHVALQCDLRVWGHGADRLPAASPIRRRYQGAAWGLDMYQVLAASRMTVNSHIDIAGACANNMRLFEATGAGTLLITDWKENLHELFEPGKEVVTYRTPEECAQRIQYYLQHEPERQAIASAGQARTLREHTYAQRMQELLEMLRRHL